MVSTPKQWIPSINVSTDVQYAVKTRLLFHSIQRRLYIAPFSTCASNTIKFLSY